LLENLNDSQRSEPESSSETDSESECSDAGSEENSPENKGKTVKDEDEDDESGPVATSGTFFQTKNEVAEADIVIPDIRQVGDHEMLEKVGEIMSVMPNMAIVKGLPSAVMNQGAERALDSDTLLVFEDRSVMGYVGKILLGSLPQHSH
jgi:H/ACA ribonucleoprotein complex non-core subunit NAF1